MPRIFLVANPKTTNEKRYVVFFEQLPPPPNSGEGPMLNENNERLHNDSGNYFYWQFKLTPEDQYPTWEDIIIEIKDDLKTSNWISIPLNGGKLSDGNLTVKLLTPDDINQN